MNPVSNFEKQYISLRQQENRLYSDGQVRELPVIENTHTHYSEWLVRASSCDRLVKHLSQKQKSLRILEVGCGNGWLCHRLSQVAGSKVTGIDINRTELDQARRVFRHLENVEFITGTIDSEITRNAKFEVIVFAASIQYFPSLSEALHLTMGALEPGGEIHIVDSHFYKSSKLETAKERSAAYYASIQAGEMAGHYFHHGIDELGAFNHKFLYNPGHILNLFTKKRNPFPWICISHHA